MFELLKKTRNKYPCRCITVCITIIMTSHHPRNCAPLSFIINHAILTPHKRLFRLQNSHVCCQYSVMYCHVHTVHQRYPLLNPPAFTLESKFKYSWLCNNYTCWYWLLYNSTYLQSTCGSTLRPPSIPVRKYMTCCEHDSQNTRFQYVICWV